MPPRGARPAKAGGYGPDSLCMEYESMNDTFSALADSVSEADFLLFQRLIEREAGIHLAPVKKALLVGRLARRLRELGILTLREYYKRVAADAAERTHMLDCI